MRKIKISDEFIGENVLRIIRRELALPAPCGSKGRCGKCRVRVLSGELSVSEADQRLLSRKEIEQGIRLACAAFANGELELEILFEENNFQAETSFAAYEEMDFSEQSIHGCGIAGDIGTTTLVFRLLDLSDGRVLQTYSALNSQRKYGADLMTRLSFAGKPEERELSSLLRSDISAAVNILCGGEKKIDKIILAGHAVLFHFLLGYPVRPLSVYPFKSKMNGLFCADYQEILDAENCGPEELRGCKLFLLPSVSAYAGSDLLAGAGFCALKPGEILLDIGTNAEMALCMNTALFCASAAAGPALEAGNISCGTGSIPGAIDRVSFYAGRFFVKTIEDKEPIGICGTGLIDAVACLLNNGLMDNSGFIGEKYQEEGITIYERRNGRISLTQKDIREFQLAKAAIRAGLECLLQACGMTWDKVNRLYLAGGFGTHITARSAIQSGLLPAIQEEKIAAAGNSSLGGAEKAILSRGFMSGLQTLAQSAHYKNLSLEDGFQELFISHMNF